MKRPTIAAPWVHTSDLVYSIIVDRSFTRRELAEDLNVTTAFITSLLDSRKPLPPRLARVIRDLGFATAEEILRAHLEDVRWRYIDGVRRGT